MVESLSSRPFVWIRLIMFWVGFLPVDGGGSRGGVVCRRVQDGVVGGGGILLSVSKVLDAFLEGETVCGDASAGVF